MIVLKSAIFGIMSLDDSKGAVKFALDTYHWGLASLSVIIGEKLLERELERTQREILQWLFPSDFSSSLQAHMDELRAKNSGTWFLESDEFRDWLNGEISLLVSQGART